MKCAIGSHIKDAFTENGLKRSVYKDVNSGGSFGSNPLRQEIGIGQAKMIDEIEIRWAGSNTVQHFKNIAPNQFLHITEGDDKPEVMHLAHRLVVFARGRISAELVGKSIAEDVILKHFFTHMGSRHDDLEQLCS